MDYDTWRLTDFDMERNCELEEAEEKAKRDRADELFNDFASGQGEAIDEIMDMLEDSDRWQDVIEALRASYYRQGETRAEKAERVLRAYEVAMDDVCYRIAESEVEG